MKTAVLGPFCAHSRTKSREACAPSSSRAREERLVNNRSAGSTAKGGVRAIETRWRMPGGEACGDSRSRARTSRAAPAKPAPKCACWARCRGRISSRAQLASAVAPRHQRSAGNPMRPGAEELEIAGGTDCGPLTANSQTSARSTPRSGWCNIVDLPAAGLAAARRRLAGATSKTAVATRRGSPRAVGAAENLAHVASG